MRLIFVRHGEPDYQKDCLTETGRILRFERHAGIGLLPCLELGSDSRHIMGTV